MCSILSCVAAEERFDVIQNCPSNISVQAKNISSNNRVNKAKKDDHVRLPGFQRHPLTADALLPLDYSPADTAGLTVPAHDTESVFPHWRST